MSETLFASKRRDAGDREPIVSAMKGDDIAHRFEELAARVITLVRTLPSDSAGRVLKDQLVRAATSGGANYEEARSAQSRADFIYKLGIAAKETREASYWLGVISKTEAPLRVEALELKSEALELTAILMSSARTAKGN